mmetsp:Transcript_32481/g.63558  ORF Transcript_32481/g.63558 Transcript_32481/m.63558 type:complete len:244 (+) Transcript_32481:114-845(+)
MGNFLGSEEDEFLEDEGDEDYSRGNQNFQVDFSADNKMLVIPVPNTDLEAGIDAFEVKIENRSIAPTAGSANQPYSASEVSGMLPVETSVVDNINVNDVFTLAKENGLYKEQNSALRQRVIELETQLLNLQSGKGSTNHHAESQPAPAPGEAQMSTEPVECKRCGLLVIGGTHNHQGQWALTADAKEFINLPDDLKTNMRREKAKRISTVISEMAYVLESDAPENAPGQWSCCSATTFYSACK